MQAQTGDKVTIHGGRVGSADRHGQVVEVHGEDGAPPFLVRFDDGHETLLFPGPDCTIEHSGA